MFWSSDSPKHIQQLDMADTVKGLSIINEPCMGILSIPCLSSLQQQYK